MSGVNIQICHYHKSVSQFKMTNTVMRSNEFNYILYRKGPLWESNYILNNNNSCNNNFKYCFNKLY